MIWRTNDGMELKIKDIPTAHLCNIFSMIKKNPRRTKNTKKFIKNIGQEIRLRKLNRIHINKEEDKLF